ncbi:MAG: hypothetical protein AAFZ15_17260 [Bacteroidota bacterium]
MTAWSEKVQILYPNGYSIFVAKWQRVLQFDDEFDRLQKAIYECGFRVDILSRNEQFCYRLASEKFRCQSEYFSCYESALYDAIEFTLRIIEQRTKRRELKSSTNFWQFPNRRMKKDRQPVAVSWYEQVKKSNGGG